MHFIAIGDQMASELEIQASFIHLRRALKSGEAARLVKDAGMTTTAVGEVCLVSQPTAWCWLAGRQFPKRDAAIRLAQLLEILTVVHGA